jgi:photosystem II stability/assembly factor-like uncharacterized protein
MSAARSASHAHRRGVSSVYRNAGDGWERIEGLPHGEGCYRAVVRAAAPGESTVLSNRGVYRSDDAGETWAESVDGERFPDAPPAGLATDT